MKHHLGGGDHIQKKHPPCLTPIRDGKIIQGGLLCLGLHFVAWQMWTDGRISGRAKASIYNLDTCLCRVYIDIYIYVLVWLIYMTYIDIWLIYIYMTYIDIWLIYIYDLYRYMTYRYIYIWLIYICMTYI